MNLSTLIDGLPFPEFPERFDEQDRRTILLALESAKRAARPYNGDYKAPWLLSDFSESEWVTTNRNREEKVRGKWKNAISIDWNLRLPNGRILTDPGYEEILTLNKKIAFLARTGYLSGLAAPKTWRTLVYVQLQLTRWLVLNEERFKPERYGFQLLDQNALEWLFALLAKGGWIFAHHVPQRILSRLYGEAFKKACSKSLLDSLYTLAEEVIDPIKDWLSRNHYYGEVRVGPNIGKKYVKRSFLAELVGEPVGYMRSSSKLSAFLRQFEPELQSGPCLGEIFRETEKLSHRTRLIKDVVETGSSEKSLVFYFEQIKLIFSAHRHIPDLIPDPSKISIQRAKRMAERFTRRSAHNPFIPIDIGLSYLNNAIRFVHVYGDALIGYYLEVESESRSLVSGDDKDALAKRAAKNWCAETGVSVSEVLNISNFKNYSRLRDFDMLRNQPTLDDMLRVLVGACIVLIALLKPSREDELTHLQRNCLREKNGGFLLNFSLGKSNVGEIHQRADRPIPTITAKAIQLLQRFGARLSELNGENRKIGGNLFYLPKFDRYSGAMAADAKLLNTHLDIFCEYVGLDPDEYDRRWYVRIHEMRKWFLLLLFWSGRYDVLDAVRWIAGHIDVRQVYAYIEREFPGEELPQLEAEYAVERLLALEARGGQAVADESGLSALYERVLHHFKVSALSMIPDSEWSDYVTSLREAEDFVLEPHSIYSKTGDEVVGMTVSFVLREMEK